MVLGKMRIKAKAKRKLTTIVAAVLGSAVGAVLTKVIPGAYEAFCGN